MPLFGRLMKWLWGQPLARGIDLESSDAISVHRKIIDSNPILKAQLFKYYADCRKAYDETAELDGTLIEIGSGAGFLDRCIPGLIRTEVVPSPFADRTLDAMNMDLPPESVRCLFLIGVFHHFPEPGKFLGAAERCLQPGGRLVMIEPSNGIPQRILCKILDHYEYFDDKVKEWRNRDSGRLGHANLALPWVIFVRDRSLFDKRFPGLKIRELRYHTFVAQLLSGGWSYRPFVPERALPLVDAVERLARPWMKWVGTTMTIDIEKV